MSYLENLCKSILLEDFIHEYSVNKIFTAFLGNETRVTVSLNIITKYFTKNNMPSYI